MPDITTQLCSAVSEEPPLGFGAEDVIAQARRARRRRHRNVSGILGASVAASVAAAVTTGLAVSGGAAPASQPGRASHAPALSLTALERTAAGRPGTTPVRAGHGHVVDGVSAGDLAGLVQHYTGVPLSGATVSFLNPPGELDLAAGIAVAGQPQLNVQVTPPQTLRTTMPTCAELSDPSSSGNGDGFYGPCSIQRLGDGSILVVRSGQAHAGDNTMAQAVLIRPDGSGIFAEDNNQAAQTTAGSAAQAKRGIGTAVRAEPVLDAPTLAKLVRSLASETQP
jgi:hypothetical protein